MKIFKTIIVPAILLLCAWDASAQYSERFGKNNDYNPVDFSVTLKNMHLWRGLEVTAAVTTATEIYFQDRSGNFRAGLWGGAGIDGSFREFDYFISYSFYGFTLAVWDIFNFSPGVPYNTDVFNYKGSQTGHFIDVSLSYRFGEAFPLGLSWATIVLGRDRGIEKQHNLYSTYVSADYPVLRGRAVDLDLGAAGAFALKKEHGHKDNFYGKDPGIVSVTATVAKVLQLGRYRLPVSATTMWNPVNNNANIQLAFLLF